MAGSGASAAVVAHPASAVEEGAAGAEGAIGTTAMAEMLM